MSDTMIPGAYLIRNKKNRKVLHSEGVRIEEMSRVHTFDQQDRYRHRQIWWIEPLPSYADKTDPVYSITIPASGRPLDMNPGEEPDKAYQIWAADPHGEAWQRWKLVRLADQGGEFFTITSIFNGHVLAVDNDSDKVHSQKFVPDNDAHCWELVIPTVNLPGWFQIQNSGTGNLLSHTYLCNPPSLLSPPRSLRPSEYRESWEFQWTLAHSQGYEMSINGYLNSWRIVNRLTRAPLSPRFEVQTPQTLKGHNKDLAWELELDPTSNWKLRNRESGCFLRQSAIPCGEGTAALCDEKVFTKGEGRQSWVLRPMQYMDETVSIDSQDPEFKTLSLECSLPKVQDSVVGQS